MGSLSTSLEMEASKISYLNLSGHFWFLLLAGSRTKDHSLALPFTWGVEQVEVDAPGATALSADF